MSRPESAPLPKEKEHESGRLAPPPLSLPSPLLYIAYCLLKSLDFIIYFMLDQHKRCHGVDRATKGVPPQKKKTKTKITTWGENVEAL